MKFEETFDDRINNNNINNLTLRWLLYIVITSHLTQLDN